MVFRDFFLFLFSFLMVAHFSRVLLLGSLLLSATVGSVSALTSSELSSWAASKGIISTTESTASIVSRASAAPLYLGIASYYW
jgi:hypothetical protein